MGDKYMQIIDPVSDDKNWRIRVGCEQTSAD